MSSFRIAGTGAVALSALIHSGAASGAETVAGVYLSYNPGRSVEYLSLVDSGPDTAVGYFAAVRASRLATTMRSRKQIFSKRIGNTLLFGNYCATRTADGFTLTSVAQDGGILQEHFVRSTVEGVNASIVALQESANRPKSGSARNATDMQGIPASSSAAQLSTAQAAINIAQTHLSYALNASSHLQTLATQARATANAALDEPGAAFIQNQNRMQAMSQADRAGQNEVVAKHRLNVATLAVTDARKNLEQLHIKFAKAETPTLSVSPAVNEFGP